MAAQWEKRAGELMRGLLAILRKHPEGLPAKEALQLLELEVPPTGKEREAYPNRPNVRRYGNFVRFYTVTLVKAGWMVKQDGVWRVTEEGEKALKAIPQADQFWQKAHRLYKVWKALQPEKEKIEEGEEIEDSPSQLATLEEAEEESWSDIQDFVSKMNPYDFQKLVAALLVAMGYHVSWIAPPGRDQGVDIIAHNDPLGTTTPRIKVQVKRQGQAVDAKELRSFASQVGEGDIGIFVATNGFTRTAEDEARTKDTRKMTLLNLRQLVDLWIQHYDKIAEEGKRLLPLKSVYYLALDE